MHCGAAPPHEALDTKGLHDYETTHRRPAGRADPVALVGCSAGSKADSAAPKDYSQILHDARTDEENEYDMIFTKGEDGKFTAIDGYSAEYELASWTTRCAAYCCPC